jgi:hypothetical protein
MIETLLGLLAAGFLFALFGATYQHRENCHGICGGCSHDCSLRENQHDQA